MGISVGTRGSGKIQIWDFAFRRMLLGRISKCGRAILRTVIASSIIVTFGSGSAIGQEKQGDTAPTTQLQQSLKMSLVHVGSNDSFNPTTEGVNAGRLLLDALENKKSDVADNAICIYNTIIPRENYGGEYTALKWFAQLLIMPESEREKILSDPFVGDFFYFFADNDFATLKEYLKRKYKLREIGDEETRTGQDRKALLEDTILFNNPLREEWERTSEILKLIKLPKGAVIADVGAGPGYYTHRFAKMIGKEGRVFSIDTVEKHLEYINRLKEKLNMPNVTTVHTDGRTIGITGQKVDAVFLCSLYHNIYAMSTLVDREKFLDSIKDSLKDDGMFYLIDNGLVKPGLLPYHGPYVAKELVVGQLEQYGFKLMQEYNPVPQRYVLIFKKTPASKDVAHKTD